VNDRPAGAGPVVRHSIRSPYQFIAPAVRTVAIVAHAFLGDGDVESRTCAEICPVHAIASWDEHIYRRPAAEVRPAIAPDHAGMVALGWEYVRTVSRFEAVIRCGTRYGPVSEASRLRFPCGTCFEVHECPWPPEEDDDELAETQQILRGLAFGDLAEHSGDPILFSGDEADE
jgi:hypothetical protein